MRGVCCLLLLVSCVFAEDVLILKNGGKVTGRVNEKGDFVEVLRDLSSVRFSRDDVLRIEYDSELHPEEMRSDSLDVLQLIGGREFLGRCTIRDNGNNVFIQLDRGTGLGFPRDQITQIIWGRQGSDDERTRVHAGLDELLELYVETAPEERTQTRRELYRLGSFAVPYLESLQVNSEGARKEAINFSLSAIFLNPLISARLRAVMPEFPVFWFDPDPDIQITVLRRASLEDPEGVTPFLSAAVKSFDREPRVKAFAISQLASLGRNQELLEVLDATNDGRMRMAVAVGLGSNGIYAGIPVLIEALKHEELDVRAAAIANLKAWTGEFRNFFPDDTAERRAQGIELWEAWWTEHAQEIIETSAKMVRGHDGVREAEREKAFELSRLANEAWTEFSRLAPDDPGRQFGSDKAEYFFERSLINDPTNIATRLGFAIFHYVVSADTTAALREFNILLKTLPPESNSRERSQVFFHQAQIAMARKNWDMANDLLRSAMAYDRDDIEARTSMGELRVQEAIHRRGLSKETRKLLLAEAVEELSIALDAMIERRSDFSRSSLNLIADESLGSFDKGPLLRNADEVKEGLKAQHGRIHQLMGRALLALNLDVRAREHLQSAYRLIPRSWRSDEEERQLKHLIQGLGGNIEEP